MANMNNNSASSYEVKIVETSRELSKIEQVMIMTNAAKKLEELVPEAGTNQTFILEGITGYAEVEIHNERSSDNKDYRRLIIFTDDKKCFYTGSPTFCDNFKKIFSLMDGEDGWGIECFKGSSQKYKGKSFMSCNLYML